MCIRDRDKVVLETIKIMNDHGFGRAILGGDADKSKQDAKEVGCDLSEKMCIRDREWEAVATPRGTISSLIDHLRELRYGKGTVMPEETKRLWQAVGKWYDEDARYHKAFRQIQEALDYDCLLYTSRCV